MRFSDTVIGCLLALVGALVIWQASGFPSRPGLAYGPALFPTIIGTGLIGCGVLLVAVRRVQGGGGPPVELSDWARVPYHLASIPVLCALIVFYILAAGRLGFVPTMFCVLAAAMLWWRAGLLMALAVAAAGTLGMFLGFHVLLRVPLPIGPVERLIW